MLWIAVIIIIVAVVYAVGLFQKYPPADRLRDLEKDIESLNPLVTNYLENCRDRLMARLDNFSETPNRLRIVTRDDMQKAIDFYNSDLSMIDKYIKLSDRFKNDISKRVEIATAYYNFLSLIDTWRRDNANLGASILDKDGNPSYNVITRLQEIRNYFNS